MDEKYEKMPEASYREGNHKKLKVNDLLKINWIIYQRYMNEKTSFLDQISSQFVFKRK